MLAKVNKCRVVQLAGWAFLCLLAGCVGASAPAAQPGLHPDVSSSVFGAALSHFVEKSDLPVLVDPRPLRPGARLSSVREADFLPDPETVRLRTAVVERAGLALTDAVEAWGCVFSEGVPPAIPSQNDSVRPHRAACAGRGRNESLVFGLPEPGLDPANPVRWRIRAMRMLPYGYEVVDLYLQRGESGEWQVVDEQVRTGAFS